MFVLGENHFRKCFSGNAGVWLVRKIEFSGNWFPLTEKKGFDYGNEFPFLFSLQMNSREREREREKHARTSVVRTHWAPVCSVRKHQRHRSRSRAIDCDLTFAPIARDRDWRFARLCRRSRSRLRADRDLAKRRGASWDCDRWCGRRTGACKAPRRWTQSSVKRQSGFVFSFFFSKHQKIFFGKFLKMQSNRWKHFPFRKMEYFPEMLLHEPNIA